MEDEARSRKGVKAPGFSERRQEGREKNGERMVGLGWAEGGGAGRQIGAGSIERAPAAPSANSILYASDRVSTKRRNCWMMISSSSCVQATHRLRG